MTEKTCAREGCDNPLKTGRTYCSTDCANKANATTRAARKQPQVLAASEIQSIRSGVIPAAVEQMFVNALGQNTADVVLGEIDAQLMASEENVTQLGTWPEWLRKRYPIDAYYFPDIAIPRPSVEPPTKSLIEPYTALQRRYGQDYVSDRRRDDNITWEDIDRMLKLGPCVLASRIKKGPIMSALSGKRKWSVHSGDNKLKLVTEADLERLFMRHVHDMLMCVDYGVFFGSTMWEQQTAEYIGVERGVGKSSKWWVIDKIESAHPSTVGEILRETNSNTFAGFRHSRRSRHYEERDVIVDPMQALVLTYNIHFGDLWGESIFDPVYDFAFWYEVVMRAFLRYLERMGTPVCIVKGPQSGTSKRPDGTRIDNPQYGLLLAGAAAMSSAIYLPSTRDLQTGQPLWEIEYLATDQKGEQFIQALEYLGTQIMRGVIVGDRAFTQGSGETGSYAAGDIHNRLTQIDNDFIFKAILGQLNRYLIKRYAMFNVDYNNPPAIGLRADVIDPQEQEVLMKLFATAGNIKLFDGSPLDRVDWMEAFRSIQVPVLTDEEFKALYEEDKERKKENAELFQQPGGAAAFGKQPARPPAQQPQSKSELQPGTNGKAKTEDQKKAEARLAVLEHLADGGAIPALLMPEDVVELFHGKLETINLDGLAMDDDGNIVELQGRRTTKGGKPVKDPEFEKVHPRDESGHFAKKEEETDEDEEGEDGETDYSVLDNEPWPGAGMYTIAGNDLEMKGVFELDGITYYVMAGEGDSREQTVTKEELIQIHEAAKRVAERAPQIYEGFESPDMFVLNKGEDTAPQAMNHPFKSSEEARGMGMVFIDDAMVAGPERPYMEQIIFHESIHAQKRDTFSWPGKESYEEGYGTAGGFPEEAFTNLLQLEYAGRFNLPQFSGWDVAIGPLVDAARRQGWSKPDLYEFAKQVHKIGPGGYVAAIKAFTGDRVGDPFDESGVRKWWPDLYKNLRQYYAYRGVENPSVEPPEDRRIAPWYNGWPLDWDDVFKHIEFAGMVYPGLEDKFIIDIERKGMNPSAVYDIEKLLSLLPQSMREKLENLEDESTDDTEDEQAERPVA